MKPTDDLRVKGYQHLMEPDRLKRQLSISQTAHTTVLSGRDAIERIMRKEDKRLLVVAGPCSIHDEKAACEYAARLKELSRKVSRIWMAPATLWKVCEKHAVFCSKSMK